MSTQQVSQRILGRVKWFNNKLGYGFISYNLDSSENKDIFVHWSHLSIPEKEFHTLYQGEYVEFVLTETHDNTHKFQADSVTGISKGALMCETRNLLSKRTSQNQSTLKKRRYTGSRNTEEEQDSEM